MRNQKPQALGNVNPCGLAKLYNKKGELVLNCLDTPNAIAFAFQNFPKCHRVVGAFGVPEQFGVKKEFKKDYADRFNSGLTLNACGIKLAGEVKVLTEAKASKPKESKSDRVKAVLSTVVDAEVISAYYSQI